MKARATRAALIPITPHLVLTFPRKRASCSRGLRSRPAKALHLRVGCQTGDSVLLRWPLRRYRQSLKRDSIADMPAKPIQVYDISLDAFREANQDDMDLATTGVACYGVLRSAIQQIIREETEKTPNGVKTYLLTKMQLALDEADRHRKVWLAAKPGRSTVINRDGSFSGPAPVTKGQDLGNGGYD
jgi:hypothetical protein